jgi:hypothetical protein
MTDTTDHTLAAWRPSEWLKAAGNPFSRPMLYLEIHRGRIDARKAGRATIILTSPREYFESLPKGIEPAAWRARKRKVVLS